MPSPRRAPPTGADEAATKGLRTLKKYPNRRLYDTQTSSYITLADVKRMVLSGEAFEVRDAKTSDDLTRSILLQIILEEESGGVPMFSTPMLAQIIRFYGHAMQGMMGDMLERNLLTFTELQSQFVAGANPVFPNLMGNYMEQSRTMFEKLQEQLGAAGTIFPGFPPAKR
jgi:polyhydroxyalkanoate synthesis repressor PhaR